MSYPNIIQQINSKIPLSGGDISGDLVFCNTTNTVNHQICVNNNSSYLEFYGGTNNNSSILQLHGNEYTANENHKASVRILTGITNEYSRKELLLKPDGAFTWGGNNVITSAGGSMSGGLISSSNIAYQTNNSSHCDYGYNYANRTGALLALRSSGYTNNPGGFEVIARNESASISLAGKIDGTLVWGGKPVVNVTKYSSGNNWYRKYTDGFIEQGGFVSASASTLADKNFTISLITSFTTTTYSFSNIIVLTAATGNWGAGACALKSKSTTSVVVIGEGAGGASPVTGIWWYACGY